MHEQLHQGFLRSVRRVPNRVALVAEGRAVTYQELAALARRLAATIQCHAGSSEPRQTAVLGDRSIGMFAGILAALLAGNAYVPLNTGFPVARTREMLKRARCRTLIVDAAGEGLLPVLLADVDPLVVLMPHATSVEDLSERWPQHTFVAADRLEAESSWTSEEQSVHALAYLLFTSGSTGTPKGVMVSHANATHFVRWAVERYGITEVDRVSQTFDTTFDLSVFDMFVAWDRGASVWSPSRAALWNPGSFIRENELTVWFSVPTVAMLMKRLGALKPDSYPSLRWSLFCGERLPVDIAIAWSDAAPHSTVENLYGPTELTVACTVYRWDERQSPHESLLGVVPIGEPLPGMRAIVVDDALVEVPPGQDGELLMSGPQRTRGYWEDDLATARAHVAVPGCDELFYRTGDRVRRSGGAGPLLFLGRLDQQVKVRGHRIELGEVESTLLECPGVESAAAVARPSPDADVLDIVAFVTGEALEPHTIRASLSDKLQAFALPRTIQVLPNLPLNANGKVDRRALLTLLDA